MKTSCMTLVLAVFGGACASTTPTPQLVSARQAYDNARMSPASQYAPDSLLTAKQALDKAERAHADDPQSEEEKSYAYVAERRSTLAMVKSEEAKSRADKKTAEQNYIALQDSLRVNAQGELRNTRNAVTALQSANNQAVTALTMTSAELEKEKKARAEAEAKAQRALESLQKIASVKEEARGTVITLSGEVLFVTGKSELLPAARDRLTEVAKALNDGDERPITIEGHTDSRGSDQDNMRLSQSRADTVRSYLIGLDVKPDRIKSVGRGEAQPIASNDTPEGRANNRRVEIIIAAAPKGPAPAQ